MTFQLYFCTGTAVYVFFILAWPNGQYTNTQFDVVLDGATVGAYIQPPMNNNAATFQYNVPVYANANLRAGSHALTITGKTGASDPVFMLFDYAVYTCVFSVFLHEFPQLTNALVVWVMVRHPPPLFPRIRLQGIPIRAPTLWMQTLAHTRAQVRARARARARI